VKFYKFYLFFNFLLFIWFILFWNSFFYKLFYCISLSLSTLPCPAPAPAPAMFVTTDRQNYLIGPKIRVALLEDNSLEMQV